MASTKEEISRECADCGRWTARGSLVVREVQAAEPGTRVAVWVCRLCQRNDQEVKAALEARERRTIGVWKKFRC